MEQKELNLHWWQQLESQWKKAYSEVFFHHTNEPDPEELARLYHSPALRFAGPRAPYPNMSFELNNLSGVTALNNLEIFVCTHQDISSVSELSALASLKSLFLFNNKIEKLKGIEELKNLEQLYVQFNNINSILPLAQLMNLKELYIHDNNIDSFEGLTEAHAENLEMFFGAPNTGLKQKEIIRVERELGIVCRKY